MSSRFLVVLFSNGLVILEENDEIDWQISDFSFVCDFSSIGKYKGFLDTIGFVSNESYGIKEAFVP